MKDVIAYMYHPDFPKDDKSGVPAVKTDRMVEYFIPSHGICFNKLTAFKSEKPRNIPSIPSLTLESEPVTLVYLPKDLVDEMVRVATSPPSSQEIETLTAMKKDYQIFFSNQAKGNTLIKQDIMHYIFRAELPKNCAYEKLVDRATALSPIENESLIQSLQYTLMIENGKLPQRRAEFLKLFAGSCEGFFTGIQGSILGGLIASTMKKPSSTGVGIAAGLGFFAGNELQKKLDQMLLVSLNKSIDQIELRANTILKAINFNELEHNSLPRASL
jgi:hypothetical protein